MEQARMVSKQSSTLQQADAAAGRNPAATPPAARQASQFPEAAWRKTFEEHWTKFCRQFGPKVTEAARAGTAEAKWNIIAHLDEWRVWFEREFTALAEQFQKQGNSGLRARLSYVITELERLAEAYRKSFDQQVAGGTPVSAPQPKRKTAQEIAAEARKSEFQFWLEESKKRLAATQKMLDDDRKRRERADAEGSRKVWDDVERFQRNSDKHWAQVLFNARF